MVFTFSFGKQDKFLLILKIPLLKSTKNNRRPGILKSIIKKKTIQIEY